MPYFLPKKHQVEHEFCFYCHDVMASIIPYCEHNRLFTVQLEFDNDSELKSLMSSGQVDQLEWLERHGYEDALAELILKVVFHSLLADYCHYMYEGLKCSEKGKLSPAFTLFRKPLKESLLYFEWMLAFPEEFVRMLLHEDVKSLAIDKMSESRKSSIVQRACEIIGSFFKEEHMSIYELRYSREKQYSFEPLWNRSVHLVTTSRSWRTERRNLNMIFSGDKEMGSQWAFLYSSLPLLMFYSVNVVSKLLKGLIDISDTLEAYNMSFWAAKFVLACGRGYESNLSHNLLDEIPIRCTLISRINYTYVFG